MYTVLTTLLLNEGVSIEVSPSHRASVIAVDRRIQSKVPTETSQYL